MKTKNKEELAKMASDLKIKVEDIIIYANSHFSSTDKIILEENSINKLIYLLGVKSVERNEILNMIREIINDDLFKELISDTEKK